MKLPLEEITMIMLRSFRELHEDGEIDVSAGTTVDPCTYFGFSPDDVAQIHTHKKGVGDGVWFRLQDGRVIDKYGTTAEGDRSFYDTAGN